MGNTYLIVPFNQKEKAKALGARWDKLQRQWYFPEGLELAAFQAWLPAGKVSQAISSPSRELTGSAELLPGGPAGMTLRGFLPASNGPWRRPTNKAPGPGWTS